jgi:hypothetical protein
VIDGARVIGNIALGSLADVLSARAAMTLGLVALPPLSCRWVHDEHSFRV